MKSIYDLDTPTLLVDLNRLEHNITSMAEVVRAGGKTLRPHTKTHKTPEIARMQIAAGASGLTVAKLGEAEVLADAGFDDIFIANQIVGNLKIERLMALMERSRVRVGVDSIDVAGPIGDAAHRRGTRASMLIEVDTGLGRAGVRSPEEALALAAWIVEHPGLEFVGIFTHEGHLYRGKESVDRDAALIVGDDMRALSARLRAQGTPAREVSVGSTPGAPLLAGEPGLTEMRPGVYVYYDRSQIRRGANADRCALTVLATVTSVRSDGRVVIDAGTKSLASDCPFDDKTYGEIEGRPDLVFATASEEHGHLQNFESPGIKVGDKLRIVPNHACTCVNMHDRLTAFRGEQVEAVWNIAGRGKIQ